MSSVEMDDRRDGATAGAVSFGTVLRRLRRAAELTQEELAERAGLSVRGISDIERGVSHAPYPATVDRLVDALGASSDERAALLRAAHRGRWASPSQRVLPPLLPLPLAALVGREREVVEVCTLVTGARLVTLTGPGGVGKTRLALAVASRLQEDSRDAVHFVSLAPLSDPMLVIPTIATALGVREGGERSLKECVVAALRDNAIILILDNLEHLPAAADDIADLLTACPRLTILATSRVPLHLQGEQEYPISPLATPDPLHAPPVQGLMDYPAIQLFAERAALVQPDFQLDDSNAATVTEICRHLDGLPLAIELAAARIKVFSPHALLERLWGAEAHDQSPALYVLTGGPRDLPRRLQTLRDAIAWSYDLLEPAEQTLFHRLSVFSDGCTFESIEAVCDGDGDLNVLEAVTALVDKSLLRVEKRTDGEIRFVMLETIRAYARERLADSGENDRTCRLHAEHFLAFTEKVNAQESAPSLPRLATEVGNLRGALRWLLDAREPALAVRLMHELTELWNLYGRWDEGERWLREGLRHEAALPENLRARVHQDFAMVAEKRGDTEAAAQHYKVAFALFDECKDGAGMVEARWGIAMIYRAQGEYTRARSLVEESLAQAQELGLEVRAQEMASNLAGLVYEEGDLDRAAEMLEDIVRAWRQRAEPGVAWPLMALGRLTLDRGDLERAEALLRESLAIAHENHFVSPLTSSLYTLAEVAVMANNPERAASLFGAEEAERERLGQFSPPAVRAARQYFLARGRAALGDFSWQQAWNEGRAMSLEGAVEFALR